MTCQPPSDSWATLLVHGPYELMDEERHPGHLWQQQHRGERQVAKLVTWSVLLLACCAIWLAISYAVWRFYLA